jgi:hypothetical protein
MDLSLNNPLALSSSGHLISSHSNNASPRETPIPHTGVGELKGSGSTIFKSEFNDMLLQSNTANNSTSGNKVRVFLCFFCFVLLCAFLCVSQDVAIATSFGLPRVNGAQSK